MIKATRCREALCTHGRPRVLFVTSTDKWAGPNISLLLLLKHLRRSIDVAVLLPGRGIFCEVLAGEQIQVFSFASLNKWSIPSILRLIKRGHFDLVYGNTTDNSSRNALIAAKLAAVPFIYHVRSTGTESWLKAPLNLADEVITISKACVDVIGKRFGRIRLHLVYNGTEVDHSNSIREIERRKLQAEMGISGSRLVLMNVGRILFVKGQKYAVQVLHEVVRNGTSAELLVVGESHNIAYFESLMGSIERLGIEDCVKLLGFRNDVNRLLPLADIYVHTAVEEPFGRAVIEAMANGLPVVAFAVGGVSEIVQNDRTGFLIKKGDVDGMAQAILRLASKPDLRSEMGQAGKLRVENCFSDKISAEHVARIIGDVLRRRGTVV